MSRATTPFYCIDGTLAATALHIGNKHLKPIC